MSYAFHCLNPEVSKELVSKTILSSTRNIYQFDREVLFELPTHIISTLLNSGILRSDEDPLPLDDDVEPTPEDDLFLPKARLLRIDNSLYVYLMSLHHTTQW